MKLALLLFCLCACAHAQETRYLACPADCPNGQSRDHSVGQCSIDPCEGRCSTWERCVVGTDTRAHCEIVPMPDMQYTRPDTSAPSSMY
jgi:hypothetical protein